MFEVKDWTYRPTEVSKQYEKGFNKINLTLENCKQEEGKKICSIKLSDDSGITWSPKFEPKVTLLV